jgi:hypothetical protein
MNECKIKDDNILQERLSDLSDKVFYDKEIYPFSGDCGNFAIALSKFVHEPEGFACSFGENIELGIDDYPIHCAMKWKGKLWDKNGIIENEEDLYDYADLTDFGETSIIHGKDFPSFSSDFIKNKTIEKIRAILNKKLCQG